MKILEIALIFALDLVVFAQLTTSWNYNPGLFFPYVVHHPLPAQVTGQVESTSYQEEAVNRVPSCLREFKYTSQRLDETAIDIQTVKKELEKLSATSQNLAKTMVTIWILTTTNLEESLKRSAESLKQLAETNSVIANLKKELSESVKDVAVMKTKIAELTTELKASTSATSIGRMPTSCQDLQETGHVKSGINFILGNKSIETVYCDFTKLPIEADFQILIGSSDVKSAPTYFSVQKNNSFSAVGIPIHFEISKVNTGEAMEIASGIFTTPRSGTYYFSFIGLAEFPSSPDFVYVELGLFLNGDVVGTGYASNSRNADFKFNQIALQMTLNLRNGDRVWLQITDVSDGVALRDANNQHYTHFSGFLLQEDLA
ncbi:hypothetical protein GHT06_011133 [Daphnia sinensis]|uniref:C1q domain-containing protein n=1 Tax=Daphnia sinensis TaxID=1820382 RepID=A0AAD5Q141_9CRUS|nr:hypothetical protein GHT06_011133 [Daphnia sinensis]